MDAGNRTEEAQDSTCVDRLCRCSAVDMLGPRNLRVSDEWYTRFRVSWDPAPSKVNGYKLLYKPKGTIVLVWDQVLSLLFKALFEQCFFSNHLC